MPVARLLRGFAALAAMMVVTQAIGFAALAVASRELGPTNLGAANFAVNLALYFAIPANFGLALLGIRDVARDPDRAGTIVGEVVVLRVALGLVLCLALVLAAPVIATDDRTADLLPLAALAIPLDTVTLEWSLLGAQRQVAVAVSRLAGMAVYALLLFLFIVPGLEGARRFIWFTLIGLAVTALLTQFFAVRAHGRPRFAWSAGALRRRALDSIPLGVAVIMVQVYVSIGPVMLGYLKNSAAVGQFTVAQKLPLALLGVVQLWSAVLYPQTARMIDERRDELRGQVSLFTGLALVIGLPLAAGGIIVGPDLIPTLFGGAYGPAGEAFPYIVSALGVSLLTANVGSVLAAGGEDRRYARGRTVGAIAAVALNVALIPLWGVNGAAATMLIAELLVFAYMLRWFHVLVGPLTPDRSRVARTMLATALMAAALLAVDEALDPIPRVAVGMAVYGAAALALGAVRPGELRQLAPAADQARRSSTQA